MAPFGDAVGLVARSEVRSRWRALLGLALQADGPGRAVPVSAHAGFDYALSAIAGVGGIIVGVATGDWYAGIFLVGVGVAMAVLAASTRFSAVRGA